jgi:RNA-dependent RNA polymerase
MVKFSAPYNSLEVVTVARKIPYYLNRNVILLGQHHKISDQTFLTLQDRHVRSLNEMLHDPSFALKFLPQLSGPDNALMNTLHHMLLSGVKPQVDPFLYSCLHCIRSHHLMNLRKKARVHVEKGAVLIGGIDELGLVPENCCFLQVPSGEQEDDADFNVIKGKVMVTKHPVMHPVSFLYFFVDIIHTSF